MIRYLLIRNSGSGTRFDIVDRNHFNRGGDLKKELEAVYWRGILITLAMAMLVIGGMVKLKMDDTRNNLNAILYAASRWTLDSNEDLQSLAEDIAGVLPCMRVTYMMDSGLILADSEQDADFSTNHYKDKEITAARRGETGRQFRISSESAALILYMAKRIAPQLILRVSYPVLEVAGMLLIYGVLLLLVFLVFYQLQKRAIARFAEKQSRQFDEIRKLLDGETQYVEAVFPEFKPYLDGISYRIGRLKEDRQEILRTMNLRSDFVANASHELRSPLTSVRGYAELLEEGLADTPEEQLLCIQTIRQECDRMLTVIDDILRLSKAERGTSDSPGRRAAAPFAEEIRKALLPRAAKKGIDIRISGNMEIEASEKDLWEIFYNLMDNAVRYGRKGGYVRVSLSEGRIVVEDNGIGIDEAHAGRIFEQFYRVEDARNTDEGGTGLGLSIVKAIVERRGGTISVRSHPGEGTSFILEFASAKPI